MTAGIMLAVSDLVNAHEAVVAEVIAYRKRMKALEILPIEAVSKRLRKLREQRTMLTPTQQKEENVLYLLRNTLEDIQCKVYLSAGEREKSELRTIRRAAARLPKLLARAAKLGIVL